MGALELIGAALALVLLVYLLVALLAPEKLS
jgi:K+-transporting ATPase KdpF subunit